MRSARADEQPARARLFVALELPAKTRRALAGWSAANLGGEDRLRLLEADSLHVTLVFLGWRDEAAIPEIADEALGPLEGLVAPILRPVQTVALPPRRPGVLALDLDDLDGRAARVQAAVAKALVKAGLHEPERRRFRPHVTVARVRRGAYLPAGRTVLPDPPQDRFAASEVVLYRSDLRPAGARYTALARARLDCDAA